MNLPNMSGRCHWTIHIPKIRDIPIPKIRDAVSLKLGMRPSLYLGMPYHYIWGYAGYLLFAIL